MEATTTAGTVVAQEVHWEDLLWALGAVCELRNIPFDGELFVSRASLVHPSQGHDEVRQT